MCIQGQVGSGLIRHKSRPNPGTDHVPCEPPIPALRYKQNTKVIPKIIDPLGGMSAVATLISLALRTEPLSGSPSITSFPTPGLNLNKPREVDLDILS